MRIFSAFFAVTILAACTNQPETKHVYIHAELKPLEGNSSTESTCSVSSHESTSPDPLPECQTD